jgi:phage-related protein (TIGR01555 family)
MQLKHLDMRVQSIGMRSDAFSAPGGRFVNSSTGLGAQQGRVHKTLYHAGSQFSQGELNDMYRCSKMLRRIVSMEPDDAIREGVGFTGFEPKDETKLAKALRKLGALQALADARRWAQLYGGAAILLGVSDGRKPHQPIDRSNLHQVTKLWVLDRYHLTPLQWNDDPSAENFAMPEVYMATHPGARSGGFEIHHSRVLRFMGLQLTLDQLYENDGWGFSLVDGIWPELRNYGSTHDYAAENVATLSQGVLGMEGYAAANTDTEVKSALTKRLRSIARGLGLLGDIVIDKDKEEYKVIQRSLAGMPDALDKFTQALIAVTDIPRSKLLGESPGGLNTGENAGETRSWYDHVAEQRDQHMTDPLTEIVDLMLASQLRPIEAPTPSEWEVDWPTLWQLSESEKADIRTKNAGARALDVQWGLVTPCGKPMT